MINKIRRWLLQRGELASVNYFNLKDALPKHKPVRSPAGYYPQLNQITQDHGPIDIILTSSTKQKVRYPSFLEYKLLPDEDLNLSEKMMP